MQGGVPPSALPWDSRRLAPVPLCAPAERLSGVLSSRN